MINSYSVAIYPSHDFFQQMDKITSYIQMAKRYGCHEIFSSAHLPELPVSLQLDCLYKLAQLVKQEQLELTVDFGGSILYEILEHEQWKQMIKDMRIDFLRLDYGYESSLMMRIMKELDIHGFVWNASIMNKQEVEEHWQLIKEMQDIEIRACHNFYPRTETGLDESFVMRQYACFQKYHIPVTTCVPSFTCPRGPLKEGLPTIEKHRRMPLESVLLQLIFQSASDSVLLGDEWISEAEFQILDNILQKKLITLHAAVFADLTPLEEAALFHTKHHIRYDSNAVVLRSQSSRQMAEFAQKIAPHHLEERKAGCITIDNERFLRYSGEIQFLLQDLPKDERVNVLGFINEQDIWKLNYYRDGFTYQFVKI